MFGGIITEMFLERARNYFVQNFLNLSPSTRRDVKEGIEKYPLFFYADTSKSTGETIVQPEKWKGQALEDIEVQIDSFLYNHWSLYEDQRLHWPHLHTVIDPKKERIYSIVEFPVVIEAKRLLSIKQSVQERGKIIALTYRLATLDNS